MFEESGKRQSYYNEFENVLRPEKCTQKRHISVTKIKMHSLQSCQIDNSRFSCIY